MARFVQRDAEGRIVAVFAAAQPGAEESLPEDHPELIGFLLDVEPAAADLARSDLDMVRVVEDVIEILIRRNVIQVTDFPEVVRDKLLRRRRARGRLADIADLIPDTEDDIL